jgi:S1-C subfamily serine protease
MNPDPSLPTGPTGPTGPTTGPGPADAPDPLDDTQPVEVPRYAPTPDHRPDTRWAWAPGDTGTTSEPAVASTPWASSATATGRFAPAQAPTASPWAPPQGQGEARTGAPVPAAGWAPAPGQPSAYAAPILEPVAPRRRTGPGIGTIVTASLLAAILASGGTVLVLGQAGALDRPAAAASTGLGQPAPSGQVTGAAPRTTVDESSAVISAASKVSPSVVKITTSGQATDPFSSGSTQGIGSGIIFDAGGWIVTNHHVVTGAASLKVELKDGRSFDGTVYGVDTLTDLAIVKINATGLDAATLGSSDALKVGQLVVAIGSPLGTYSFSVTSGIVSGKGRRITVSDGTTISNLIQTDAAINPGNSGGPLADATGAIVGINTAVATDSSGIGFAIPIAIAKPIMEQAIRGEALSRPWIGIRFQPIDLQVKADLKLTVDNGALITASGSTGAAVQANSPAEKAGLKDGDIILSINGIAVDGEHPLDALLVQFAPKDTISLSVLRNGATITVPLTLGVRPDNLQ